jgi:hypothetical protein
VAGPIINTQPQPSTVEAPGAANFSGVATTSGGALLYQWQLNSGSGWGNVPASAPYTGTTTATLSINPTSTALSGNLYRFAATDDNGTRESASALLTVIDPGSTTGADGSWSNRVKRFFVAFRHR